MAEFVCPICKIQFDKNNRKAFILECGDSACSECIKFFKESGKEQFECGKCCNNTKALKVENKSLYRNVSNQNNNRSLIAEKDEFEIYIRKKNTNDEDDKFPFLVKKTMKIRELKDKIKEQKNIEPNTYELAFKKPLSDLNKTLEAYQINKTVTVTMISIFEGGI